MTLSVTGDNIQFPDLSVQDTAATGFGFKNRIINGDMRIDQRNAGASVTATNSYPVDRFFIQNITDGAFSAQQDTSAPVGFVSSLKFTTTTADATLATTQNITIQHRIEGTNVSDLGWGTANAKTVTLSFWVRSSLTGTFGGTLVNNGLDRSHPFTYTISVADTWEYKTATISGDTSGTWLTTTGIGIRIYFGLGVGTDRSGTAGVWAAANYNSATGATSVVGTSGATFYITGVQLEKGSTATSFDYRDYGRELAMCQRYLPAYSAPGGVEAVICGGSCATTTIAANTITFPVSARVPPTGLIAPVASKFEVLFAAAVQNGTAFSFSGRATTLSIQINLTVAGGLTVGQGCQLAWNATSTSSDVLLFTGCEL